MQTRIISRSLFVLVLVCFCQVAALSQELPSVKNEQKCTAPNDGVEWLNCLVYVVAAARINQTGTSKQVETPSIADNTTSLVDQTEAPDLMGFAFNFAGLKKDGDSDDDNSAAPSLTTTAYALYAGTKKQDPLDPAFYQRHAGLRRLSFTIGRDDGEADDENDDATILGFKYLIINKRDASNPSNRTEIAAVSNAVALAGIGFVNLTDKVQRYLLAQLGPGLGYPKANETNDEALIRFIQERMNDSTQMQSTLNMITPDQMDEIMSLVENGIDAQVNLQTTALESFEKIRRRPQLSFSFQSKQRREDGTDEYRTGLLYDVGLYQKLNFAANATFDYDDSKIVGGDKRGGRLAIESYFHLNQQKSIDTGKDPITLSFEGEGKWMTAAKPTYVGQAKLTIPLFDGMTIPISISVANRSDLIDESEVRGRFGFTFDLAKVLKGLKR
jgi:hypothetical protein